MFMSALSVVCLFLPDPVLYSGADSTAPPVYLPLGDHNNGYILGMVVDVADIHGATVQFKMNVTVIDG